MTPEQAIKEEAHRLGFSLAGFTSADPPPHIFTFDNWLKAGHHGEMHYLENERNRKRRANPKSILPECETILVLAMPYMNPDSTRQPAGDAKLIGRIAAYAWGDDYHEVIPAKLRLLMDFIEQKVGHTVPNRYYTDTGPLLERDLGQRAGLGWIGKNTCLINPRKGSYFFLAEILLGINFEQDAPFLQDFCGTCTRCIEACPTHCILPDRTIDARRCISYLTIELKDSIPKTIRPYLGNWIFGCDLCQIACPWNRFASAEVDTSFSPRPKVPFPNLFKEIQLSPHAFNQKFKNSPVKRAKRRGYLRNSAIAMGNSNHPDALTILQSALKDPEIQEHAAWAIQKIEKNIESTKK